MVNGSWFMAQGWLGAWPGPQSQGARNHPWAMSHEALTIKKTDWLSNQLFDELQSKNAIVVLSLKYPLELKPPKPAWKMFFWVRSNKVNENCKRFCKSL